MSRLQIVIGTPCHGGVVTHGYMLSVIRLTDYARQNTIDLGIDLITHDALITRARSSLAGGFLDRPDATHLLFIDSDISFGVEQFDRLLKFDKDIVAAAYPIKNIDWKNLPLRHNQRGEPLNEAGLRYVGKICSGAELKIEDDFATAEYAGTGFLLIKRVVFERLTSAHPELQYQHIHNFSGPMASSRNLYALFDCMIDKTTGTYLSEDYSFCRRWRDLGGEVWIDLRSQLTHTGPFDFKGNTKVFFAGKSKPVP